MTQEPHDPERKTFSAQETRQGHKGWIMLLVLMASLGLVIIVFAIVILFSQATENPTATTGISDDTPAISGPADTPNATPTN